MIEDDEPNEWSFEESSNNWGGAGNTCRPTMTVERLRDGALALFNDYLAHRLAKNSSALQMPRVTSEMMEIWRRHLSVAETENILKEFGSPDEDAPEGVVAIGANSVEELNQKMRDVMHALMNRIMSNLVNEGVNLGLIDCAFDSEANEFAFRPSEKGEKIIKKIRKLNKKKKKGDDPED